jgi:UDP-N-acetylmuramoylalanine--D-glutamate ligase
LAIRILSKEKNIVLIFGGAKGDGVYGSLYEAMPKYIHTLVLLPGSGTILERKMIDKIEGIKVVSAPNIEEAVIVAVENAKKGDLVLYSPGFDAVGLDGSRRERGDKFQRAVRAL